MGIRVSYPVGSHVTECDANTTNAAIMFMSLIVRLAGCLGISLFHQVS